MPGDQRIISNWNDVLTETLVEVVILAGDINGGAFLRFGSDFSKWAPKVDVVCVADRPHQGPAIEIRPNLRYRAIPAGPELAAFLDALSRSPSGWAAASKVDPVAAAGSPVLPRLYIADGCPFCPTAVRKLIPLSENSPLLDLTIIDVEMFPDDAAADGIKSVPTLVFSDPIRKDRLQWSGMPDISEALPLIAARDPSRLQGKSMEQMIQEGRAEELAGLMLEKGRIFPALIDILVHEKWPTRLGAMVVAETLAAENRKLAGDMIDPLWERFHDADETVRGDILYVLGVVGDGRALVQLRSVRNGPYSSQVKEAAEEAIENISTAMTCNDD